MYRVDGADAIKIIYKFLKDYFTNYKSIVNKEFYEKFTKK